MGLDMYLSGRRFLWTRWGKDAPAQKDDAVADAVRTLMPEIGDMRVQYIEVEALYWRKANHIHAWFVKNCQNNVDDCRRANVNRDQLEELVSLCDTVLKDRSRAEELLPTQSGFFFGGTEYDEYYFKDCEKTRDGLRELLDNKQLEEWDFSYHSSW